MTAGEPDLQKGTACAHRAGPCHARCGGIVIDQVIEHASRLGDWIYVIIFLGAALECSAFLAW